MGRSAQITMLHSPPIRHDRREVERLDGVTEGSQLVCLRPELNVAAELFAGKRLLSPAHRLRRQGRAVDAACTRYGRRSDKLYVLVRKGSALPPSALLRQGRASEPFEPLRDAARRRGGSGVPARRSARCWTGTSRSRTGLTDAEWQKLKGNVDAASTAPGLVSFNPSLEVGLNVNTHGVKLHRGAVQRARDRRSCTCPPRFVAGNRAGLVFEDEEIEGYFPRRQELDGRDFSLEQELADCEKLVARLRERADDKALRSLFRKKALEPAG